MSHVRGIVVNLVTQDVVNAGTDDHLYVGLVGRGGGREFPLDVIPFDDFERGASTTYWLGTVWDGGAIVGARKSRESEPGQRNDPESSLRVELAQVDYVYLRKGGTRRGTGDDQYGLANVTVTIYGASPDRRTFASSAVWLANEYGHWVWLREIPVPG